MAKRSRPNRIVCVIVHTSTFYPIAQYFYTLREVFQLSPLQTRYFLFYITQMSYGKLKVNIVLITSLE